jgi:prevent-host-death family protein
MHTVGAFEAKTNLSKLLARVAKGERITIEKHGVPVATLEPAKPSMKRSARETIAQIREFRSKRRLGGGMSIREMIEEGRR